MPKSVKLFCKPLSAIILIFVYSVASFADTSPLKPVQSIGGAKLAGWQGISVSPDGALLKAPGTATYRYPTGPRGWYVAGFRTENDSTGDWRGYYGVQFDAKLSLGRGVDVTATVTTPLPALRQEFLPSIQSTTTLSGSGWQTVTLPFSSFNLPAGQTAMLHFVQQIKLAAKFADGKPGLLTLRNIRLTRAPVIALDAEVCGKAVQPGETATYNVTISNCTDVPRNVSLSFAKHGWEAMPATVSPSNLRIAPYSVAAATVTVNVPNSSIAAGGHEEQNLIATDGLSSSEAASLTLITARDVARPSILMTPEGWDAIRQKVKDYDWARSQQAEYVKAADAWQVPITPADNYNPVEKHTFVFRNIDFVTVQKVATAWQLTRNIAYAQKVALFLRRLADPKTGYPSTFAGTDEGGPQEGENFQAVAVSYDAIMDANILTVGDKKAIEHTFRLYMDTMEDNLTGGNVGNWSTAQSTACLYCSLAIGDLSKANRYIYGPCGFTDFVSKGIMDDGWWWECSTSYNFWVTSELTQVGLAVRPWGIDLLDLQIPANFSTHTIINPWALNPPYGISFEKWGPNHQNTRSVKQMWDAIPAIADYRGIAFGMNDGHEELASGARLELAYYVYHDPAYAALIKQGGKRDLIYGVPDLPTDTPQVFANSAYAENIGYALLRSQTDSRPISDQIETVIKGGTQGGFHGHFDRASLDNITRYGESFWNPETIWWGYPNYLYKFYVQSSLAANMVVVDQKQQEAVASPQLVFHGGKMMQVAAIESNARWSDPPYGGMQYFPGDTFTSQMRKNVQSIPLDPKRAYGALGAYTDRVLQRRLAIVTDDYIVLADYLKGSQQHTFDNIFQMKEFSGLESAGKQFDHHDGQFSSDIHSAGQFITDCDWYNATAPSVGHFAFRFGPGADNAGTRPTDLNNNGTLKMDVHSLWPQNQKIMVGMPPEVNDSRFWVKYSVNGDGKPLATGESGMWILGSQDVDVPVANVSELTLNVNASTGSPVNDLPADLKTLGGKKKTLFWSNPRIVTADGTEIPLTSIDTGENIQQTAIPGADYYGGPIKIAGLLATNAFPTHPVDFTKPAVIHISLVGKNAVRFKATLGGDYPFGDETQRRKVYDIRSEGNDAHFLTVLEPFKTDAMVINAVATGPNTLQVELADGRTQDISIANLDGDGKNIKVSITESRAGQVVRSESTDADAK